MWNTSVADGGYGYPGMGGWFGGGSAGGAFLGGLAGGLVGDLFFPDGRRGGSHCNDGEKVVQINGQPYGWNGQVGQWELMKEMSDCRREVAVMPYIAQNTALEQTIGLNQQLMNLQAQMANCCCQNERISLEGQYKALLATAGLSREMAECCCDQKMLTTTMGFETQLRDQTHMGILMKEIQEVKCLVKDVEKDGIIRAQENELNNFRRAGSDRITIDAINALAGRLGGGLNQIGVNQINTDPATSKWPPWVPTPVYSL